MNPSIDDEAMRIGRKKRRRIIPIQLQLVTTLNNGGNTDIEETEIARTDAHIRMNWEYSLIIHPPSIDDEDDKSTGGVKF